MLQARHAQEVVAHVGQRVAHRAKIEQRSRSVSDQRGPARRLLATLLSLLALAVARSVRGGERPAGSGGPHQAGLQLEHRDHEADAVLGGLRQDREVVGLSRAGSRRSPRRTRSAGRPRACGRWPASWSSRRGSSCRAGGRPGCARRAPPGPSARCRCPGPGRPSRPRRRPPPPRPRYRRGGAARRRRAPGRRRGSRRRRCRTRPCGSRSPR